MKKLFILILLILLAVLTAGSVYAQSRIRADIPFAFTVVDKTLVPGVYSAEQRSHQLFRRYGESYFLAQVWMGAGNTVGCEIPKSYTERQIARNAAAPEWIYIAAK